MLDALPFAFASLLDSSLLDSLLLWLLPPLYSPRPLSDSDDPDPADVVGGMLEEARGLTVVPLVAEIDAGMETARAVAPTSVTVSVACALRWASALALALCDAVSGRPGAGLHIPQ